MAEPSPGIAIDLFEEASKRAELWLSCVSMVALLGSNNRIREAYEILLPPFAEEERDKKDDYVLVRSWDRYVDVLKETLPKLSAFSDGPITWPPGLEWSESACKAPTNLPDVWSSAHETALRLTEMAIDLLVCPLVPVPPNKAGKKVAPILQRLLPKYQEVEIKNAVTDPERQKVLLARHWKKLVIESDQIALLQERIRRERAKLLVSELQSPVVKPPREPKAVWLGHGKVQIGEDAPLQLEQQFADVLQALVEAKAAIASYLAKHSGRDCPGKILKRLVKRHSALAPFISFPGKRSNGGYKTTIIDRSKSYK
jgi:hypothetical protein